MLWNTENGNRKLPGMDMDYIRFGNGAKVLVMLPGLGDGLRTVRGTAPAMALMYRAFAREYTVYAFSRKNRLSEGCTTREIAERIPNAELYLYADYGHGLYEEAKDFNSRVLAFLEQGIGFLRPGICFRGIFPLAGQAPALYCVTGSDSGSIFPA